MYQASESPAITRHYVNLGDRQVHFRLAGSGPVLIMLHQSPTSSAEMATDIEDYARDFTVVAPDTPGYGQSDPLPQQDPDITDFANALEQFISALGAQKVLVYGFHTGGVIGFEFARLFPERCAGVVVNGLTCIEGEELDDLLTHYNVVPEVTVTGTHLPWLWARLRDQTLFFPWYRKTAAARMSFDLHEGSTLHPYLVDFLRAKEGGRPAYQAAFAYPTRTRMPDITAPVFLVNFAPDPLTPHPERLEKFPASVERRIYEDFDELQQAIKRYLLDHAPDDFKVPRRSVGESDEMFRHEFVTTDAGPVHVILSAPAPEGAVLLLHDAGSSSRAFDALATKLAHDFEGRRTIVRIDLPGHGETGELQIPVYTADSIAILLRLVLTKLEMTSLDIIAVGASTLIASSLAQQEGVSTENLLLVDPWFFLEEERTELSQSYAPMLIPGNFGEHLLEAWYYARDSELFWPWNRTDHGHALSRSPEITAEQTQARMLDVLKASAAFPKIAHDLLSSDCKRPFQDIRSDIVLCARRGNGHEARAEAAARLNDCATYNVLPAETADWSAEVVQLLKLRH